VRKNCDVINKGLPKVPINEKGEIINKWKDKKKSTVLEGKQKDKKMKERNKT
jgi:hypothetical protein